MHDVQFELEALLVKVLRSHGWIIIHHPWSGDCVARVDVIPQWTKAVTLNLTELAKDILKETQT